MTHRQPLVHISRIHPHPGNIRADLGDLTEMTASIRAHGVLQPLVVQPHPDIDGGYQLIAGHRRLEAARRAGRDQLPVTVRQPGQSVVAEELMLVENCHRRDLNPMDKAEAMGVLRDQKGYTAARIARRTGLSDSAVGWYLTLLELDPKSRGKVRDGTLAAADAIAGIRRLRKKSRAKDGKPEMGGGQWEPDHFTRQHPLARKAAAMCQAREHSLRRRVGKIACGQCWETVIRRDERLATEVLRSVS